MVLRSTDLLFGDKAIGVAERFEKRLKIFAVDGKVDLPERTILVRDAFNDFQARIAIACSLQLDGIFARPLRIEGNGIKRLPCRLLPGRSSRASGAQGS